MNYHQFKTQNKKMKELAIKVANHYNELSEEEKEAFRQAVANNMFPKEVFIKAYLETKRPD